MFFVEINCQISLKYMFNVVKIYTFKLMLILRIYCFQRQFSWIHYSALNKFTIASAVAVAEAEFCPVTIRPET